MLNQNHTYLLCKSKLESALFLHRNNLGDVKYPAFGIKFFEKYSRENVATVRKRSGNQELIVYFLMAVNRHQNNERERCTNRTHRISSFLLRYF